LFVAAADDADDADASGGQDQSPLLVNNSHHNQDSRQGPETLSASQHLQLALRHAWVEILNEQMDEVQSLRVVPYLALHGDLGHETRVIYGCLKTGLVDQDWEAGSTSLQ
jgi:hypothetical protein